MHQLSISSYLWASSIEIRVLLADQLLELAGVDLKDNHGQQEQKDPPMVLAIF